MSQSTDTTRILVVEDEILVARDLQDLLTEMGYEVPDIAGSGEGALRKIEALRPDLVLMDIRIRGDMDGVAVAEQVRRRFRIPVVYLTAYADDTTVQRAKITEPFGYVLKPFQERELETTIEIALYKHDAERRIAEAHSQLQQAHARLGRQFKELQGRDRLVQFKIRCNGLAAAQSEILEVVADVMEAQNAVLYEPDAGLFHLEAVAFKEVESDEPRARPPSTLSIHDDDHVAVQAFATSQPRRDAEKGTVAVPMAFGEATIGVIWVGGFAAGENGNEEAPYTLWRLAQQAALLLRMARVNEAIECENVPVNELLELEAEVLDNHES